MARKSSMIGAKIHNLPPQNRKAAKDPNQIQIGLTRRAETALQMVNDSTPTAPRMKGVNRITHVEKNINNKIKQLEAFLSHSATAYSLGEILSIYNTFKEVRFAVPIQLWGRMMQFWNVVGSQKVLDDYNKRRALTIPMELLDELMQMNKLGVYGVMKQRNVHIPEHLLQFNLRPTTPLIGTAMSAMINAGNYEGALKLFETHQEMLNEIPDVQYLPSPLMPEGPEKEQEFVSRRLMATRRQELQNSNVSDKVAMQAAQKLRDGDKIEELMEIFMTQRAYKPTQTTMKEYQTHLVRTNQPVAHILMFKEYYQADSTKQLNQFDFHNEQIKILDKLEQNGKIRTTRVKQISTQKTDQNDQSDQKEEETKQYLVPLSSSPLNTNLPEFLGHVNMKRETLSPTRYNWVELLRSVAQLHPEIAETDTKSTSSFDNAPPNTTETGVSVVDQSQVNQLKRFVAAHDMKALINNPSMRKKFYKICREEYGIAINKSFFLPMIQTAQSYDEVLAWIDDFHQQVDEFRIKFSQNPQTEEEKAAEEKDRKIKSMLIVDLNVTPHDQRMKHLFGRFINDVKELGYDGEFYAQVHKRLVHFLVETYQRDSLENEYDTSTSNGLDDDTGMYEIETIVGPDGQLQKIKKLKLGEDGQPITLHIGQRKSLHELFKQKKISTDGGDGGDGRGDDISQKPNKQTNTGEPTTTSTTPTSTSQTSQALLQIHNTNLPAPLTQTAQVKVVERFNQETTQMLLSSTTRKRVKHILSSIQTVRAYQESYGLPVNPQAESNYLESLVLMSRRNEIYPPVLSTNDTSLIKYNIAPYIPSFDGESTSKEHEALSLEEMNNPINKTKPLVTFKDRIFHIHNSILRREAQLRLTMQEIEHSIDALATMKNEIDGYGALKQLNLKVLNDAIISLSELSVDASTLRGPFDAENIFEYSAMASQNALDRLGKGEILPGMKIDKKSGAKYVPGLTEPHPHQIDRVDLDDFNATCARVSQFAFGEMKSSLQKLISLSTGMTAQQCQHLALLKGDQFGSMVTENTYIPLLKACASHGDFANVLLLVESAHQHRDVIPTTTMLNFVAVAFMNSTKPRHASGVLDIMETASKPENRKMRRISEDELTRAITHGTAEDLLTAVQSQLDTKILPNAETVSLLLRMYKGQGMLDHIEELWRKLTYHDPSSWTSFSAVEEQKMVAQVLANELDTAIYDNNPMFEELRGTHKGDLNQVPNLSMAIEDVYDRALNPVQNKALAQALRHDEIRTNMSALLYNKGVDSLLPYGAHRSDIPKSYTFSELRLDSASMTIMMQSFIQLGHPMHSLQLYLDMRQSMPLFPINSPAASNNFKRAVKLNRLVSAQEDPNNPTDSLTDFMKQRRVKTGVKYDSEGNEIPDVDEADDDERDLFDSLAIPVTPSKRSFVTDKALMVTNGNGTNGAIQTDSQGVKIVQQTKFSLNSLSPKMVQLNHSTAQQTQQTVTPSENALMNSSTYEQLISGTNVNKQDSPFEQIRRGQWFEVDAVTSIALYAYKKGDQYLKKKAADGSIIKNVPPEVLVHAELLVKSSEQVISLIKRYTVDHPYLAGDASTLLYFSSPGTLNNLVSPQAGTELTSPRLLLPYTNETEEIYNLMDSLVYSDIALEETVFKMRYQTIKPIGMQRWFTIFPTMINQAKSITHNRQQRVDIIEKLDALRDDVEMLLATGRRKPKYVRIAEIIEEKRVSGEALTADEVKLIGQNGQNGPNSMTPMGRDVDSAESNQLNIGGLHNVTKVEDRGISHPKTTQFTNATLPSTPEFDLKEFTSQDSVNGKAWASSFKQFFNSKQDTADFLKKVAAAAPQQALDDNKKEKLKKKLLAQTMGAKLSDSVGSDVVENEPNGQQIQKQKQTLESLLLPTVPHHSPNMTVIDELSVDTKTSTTTPAQTELVGEKFDRWVNTANPQKTKKEVQEEKTKNGELPHFPFMKKEEKHIDSKKLLQQIRKELDDANNGFGLYQNDPIIGPDGKVKTTFLLDNSSKEQQTITAVSLDLAESNFETAKLQLQQSNRLEQYKRAEYQRVSGQVDQYGGTSGTVGKYSAPQNAKSTTKNSLLLPEVQQMKQHLSKQAQTQRAIMDQYYDDGNDNLIGNDDNNRVEFKRNQKGSKKTKFLPKNGYADENDIDPRTANMDNLPLNKKPYHNKLHNMISSDLTLLKPFQMGSNDDLDTTSQPAQWLTSPTDLAVATQVTQRHVQITKDRFKPLPGIIDPGVHKLNQRGELMQKLQSGNTVIESKPVTPQRPGGIHTSPHGPQSYRPENQFRSPASMAKLANTPDNEVDRSKLAVDNEEKRIKFTVATHGVGLADRPGRPTKISQEYLEKYFMGIGSDPKDRRNQARHADAEDEYDRSPMDPSFIQPGDSGVSLTNRGGGVLKDGSKAGTHQEGYGVGVHMFRERSKAKLTDVARSGAKKLLEEFENEAFVVTNKENPLNTVNDDRGELESLPRKERELLEYRNLFEMGGSDDELGAAAMSRTGKYTMLSQKDRQARDQAASAEGFAELESQMNQLFSKREKQHSSVNSSLGQQFQFGGPDNTAAAQKKVKEVFSSAMMHGSKDYYGSGNKKGGNKRPDQSTMFD
jgi:hypothetical protein